MQPCLTVCVYVIILSFLHSASHSMLLSGAALWFCVKGAWGNESVPPDNSENMDGKMEYSNVFSNTNLEHRLKQFRASEKIFKTGTLNCAFWRYLKQFGTAEIKMKATTINGAFWRHLELQRSFWHKDAFVCIILTHSETIFETAMRRNSTCFTSLRNMPSAAILDFFWKLGRGLVDNLNVVYA